MPVGTAFHERTFALCESMNYREWSGYFAVSAYEAHHDHEYNAIRNAAALIDVSPLYKYRITGRDAAKFINRVITRDIRKVSIGQVIYCCWCDEEGKVVDDGTIARLGENTYRWTAADPSLRWFLQNASGLDVRIEDVSEEVAALALQGPASARILVELCGSQIAALKYYRVTPAKIAGVDVEISRTGYTGDLGYEIWIPAGKALRVWDSLFAEGVRFGIYPAGMLALDIARIEAGLLLIEVDYTSSKKALISAQTFSPYELGFDRMVHLDKEHFIGRDALIEEKRRGPKRRLAGLEINWDDIERLHENLGLPPQVSATASRVAVPVFSGGTQIGKATSTTWSPALKKMIALASLEARFAAPGTSLAMELTVEAVRHSVRARTVPLPFFNPPRKTAVPAP
ncbi:MAG: aminomethyltransferase family protein [Candidatus Acidiferrales bacterium]